MVPTIAQQLQSIRRTLAATVVPSIEADASFAREQAGLILATLDLILDVQASEYRYELLDHLDARALVAALDRLGADADGADRAGTPPADLDELRAQTLHLKQRAEQRFTALGGTDQADEAWRIMSAAARRQSERELSWARMTGFPKGAAPIAAVLDRQAAEPALQGAR